MYSRGKSGLRRREVRGPGVEDKGVDLQMLWKHLIVGPIRGCIRVSGGMCFGMFQHSRWRGEDVNEALRATQSLYL